MKTNKEAWNILTSEEQMAISLSLSQGKSSWEIGEIMGKSHYKLLEIMARAKRFFKLFTEYLDEHVSLFPEGLMVDPDFQYYIEKSILKRLSIKLINYNIDNPAYLNTVSRYKEVEKGMKTIKSQKEGKDLYDLILEFDRWNNHRILPDNLQEPSAFKRRNKTREKNRLKLVSNLDPMIIDIIKKEFVDQKGKKSHTWLPIIDSREKNKRLILKISGDPSFTGKLSYMGLYYFRDFNDAVEYIDLVKSFVFNEDGSCKKGLIFWPQYRVISSKAINYNKLENIKVNRKYFEKMIGLDDREVVRRRNEPKEERKKKRRLKSKPLMG